MQRLLHRLAAMAALTAGSISSAQTTMPTAVSPQELYVKAQASLVVVRYTWASELGPREMETPGVIIDATGVAMCNAAIVNDVVPLKQIQDPKIIVRRPGNEPLELAAEYQGRDDRCGLAYFKATAPREWTPLTFSAGTPVAGDTVYSIGLLNRSVGYKAVIGRAMVSATRDEGPQVLVDDALSGVGAVVFDAAGRAMGYAVTPPPQVTRGQGTGAAPPTQFVPASAFVTELADRPTPQKPIITAWMGVTDWNGLKTDEAAYYGIDTPAIHIGGVIPGGPFEKAGLKPGDVLVKCDGRPLASGDDADSVPTLLRQRVLRMKAGQVTRFEVISAKGEPPHTVDVTLGLTPASANTAARFWAETLGFGVRDAVHLDRFARRLPADAMGVVVTMIRPGARAEAARLTPDVFVKQVAGKSVADSKAFAAALEEQQKLSPHEPVVLLVHQRGRDETIRIETN